MLNFWHWLILSVLMFIAELVIPTTIFIWTGIAAAISGIFFYFFPYICRENQVLLFSVLSILLLVISRYYLKRNPQSSSLPYLNQRPQQYLGRTFKLTSPVEGGRGKIKIDDCLWTITGKDVPVGTYIKIIAVNNGAIMEFITV